MRRPIAGEGEVAWRKYAESLEGRRDTMSSEAGGRCNHPAYQPHDQRCSEAGGQERETALRQKYPNDALQRLERSEYDYYSTHGDYVPELAALLLIERAALDAKDAALKTSEEQLRAAEEALAGAQLESDERAEKWRAAEARYELMAGDTAQPGCRTQRDHAEHWNKRA